MADVTITADTESDSIPAGFRSIVWSSQDVGYHFHTDSSENFVYQKTSDSGATWGSTVSIEVSSVDTPKFAIWADWWTPGDSGTLINILYLIDGEFKCITLDVSDDSLSTAVQVVATDHGTGQGNQYPPGSAGIGGDLDLCKSRGGNLLFVSILASTSGGNDAYCYRSTDGGSSWTSRANPFESSALDRIILQPGDAADNNDFMAIFWDVSADEIDRKNYDDSGNSWSTTNITSAADAFTLVKNFAAAPRHSDNKSILIHHTAGNASTNDLLAWEVGSASITSLTDVFTNEANHISASITINQINDDIYAFYAGDPAETFITAMNVRYKKSTDGGTTWGTAVVVNDAAAGNYAEIYADISVGSTRSGRIQAVWVSRAPNPDLFVTNVDNSVGVGVATATLSGTIFDDSTEAAVAAGGKTLIITLSGVTWDSTIGADNALTTALINGIDSAQMGANGWDTVVKAGLDFNDVVRTSDTVVTITLPAFAAYDISSPETITATIPGSAVGLGSSFVQRQTDGENHGTYRDTTVDTFLIDDTAAVLMGNDGGDKLDIWLRFTSVTIAQGTTITSAKLTFQATSASQPGSPVMKIYGLDEDNSAQIADTDVSDYLARDRTTAAVDWTIESWTPGSADHDTPDLTDIVQEIVDRGSWASGNAMAFVIEDNGSPSSEFRRAMSVQGSASGAPQLTIEY